jgi:hypothetical protein
LETISEKREPDMNSESTVTRAELDAVSNRLTSIVARLNEVNENGRRYVDQSDDQQDKKLKQLEERISKLLELKIKNYDKLVRSVVQTEFAKIGK